MLRRKSSLDSSCRSVSFSQRTTVHLIESDDSDFCPDDSTSVTSSSSTILSEPSDEIMSTVSITEEKDFHRSPKELLRLRLKDLTAQMQTLRLSMVTTQNDLLGDLRGTTRGNKKKNHDTDQALKSQLEELRKVRAAQAHLREALRVVSATET